MDRVDVTVIGAGPVGLFAAFYSGMRGMSVRIIDSLTELGGQLTALYPEKFVYDMPGFPGVLAKDLAAGSIQQGLQFDPHVVLGETANELVEQDEGYAILGSSGREFPTRTVIISAGNGAFSPTRLGIAGEERFWEKGLYYGVKSKAMFEGKDIVIVGGGDSAFDWALNLSPLASKVRLLHRRDQFRAHDETVDAVQRLGVEFILWSAVKELHGEGALKSATIENLQTKELSEIDFDAMVVNIGYKSSLGPLKDWGLVIEKNQIVVNHRCETGIPGVFAVGDVCSYPEKIKLIATGVGEAATAVCYAKQLVDPSAKLFPGHSSDMDIFGAAPSV